MSAQSPPPVDTAGPTVRPSATEGEQPPELDLNGLCGLIRALQARCECEVGEPREECRASRLDRWWVLMIAGDEESAA